VRTGFVDSNDDFDLKNKERSDQPKKFKDAELQVLLNENSPQTLEKLAEALNVNKSTFLIVYTQ